MVAGGGQWVGQAREYADPGVLDRRGLSMHQRLGSHDMAAESLSDRLVPKTHPQDRDRAGKSLDQRQRDPGFVRRAGARRYADVLWRKPGDSVDRDLVVSIDPNVFTELAEVLDQVVRE